ncbi:DUF1735 domain-containing protein, partial [Flavihumibacter sp. CACIAM 22H1]|uniref:DUF1735 domain-containing protein n=1 Tax=Flavihumibacter sp. CACIAM 22H1 TaxID=1812911 RepID=UPI0025C534FD
MKHTLNKLFVLLAISTSISSCVKNEVKDLGSAGSSIIKILGGTDAPKIVALDLKPGAQSAAVLDIRRDANSEASLNQPVTVTLTNKQALLDAYNDEEGTEYEVLPSNVFTISDPSVVVSGDTWTLNFAAGEFAKEIKLNVDAEKFDLSRSYALGFEIATASAGVI